MNTYYRSSTTRTYRRFRHILYCSSSMITEQTQGSNLSILKGIFKGRRNKTTKETASRWMIHYKFRRNYRGVIRFTKGDTLPYEKLKLMQTRILSTIPINHIGRTNCGALRIESRRQHEFQKCEFLERPSELAIGQPVTDSRQ